MQLFWAHVDIKWEGGKGTERIIGSCPESTEDEEKSLHDRDYEMTG